MSGVRWRGQGGQGYGGSKGLERRGAEGSLAWLGWVSEGQSGEMRLAGQWEMLRLHGLVRSWPVSCGQWDPVKVK